MPSAPSQTRNSAVRRPRPTTARGPRLGGVASLALHGGALAVLLFGFQHRYLPPSENTAVPVELVTIAAKTNITAAAPPPTAPAPPQEEKFVPKPEAMTPPPEPDMAEPAPVPDVTPPKIEVEKPKTGKQAQKDLSSLLDSLTQPDKPVKNARNATHAQAAIGLGTAMTASLVDALRSQIRRCWSPIPGAPNPADQVVEFDLRLNPDGSIGALRTLTLGGNAYTSAAIQAGSRAIYQCQPYKLPPEQYSQWREINPLRFDPRQMVQQ